ncbi:RNA polymerase sigma-70 factor [Actinokineospora spheciospongiae]|uniref:RNA polymerase sigma-70 factor n=1 Tax=Actinokineospora spheciospongiae TaxID=909613 RepID=W7JE59_9PSEU|nr:RNA polymerase sigma factor SigJ [Actinokineospora spheciospongiae]EWC64269.1 RNA polymerase sigma-70 factor [Actinokineospora spheciospongiae]PWW54831.1 RNA polymerase sigma-70 factor (ECF subfamily) [Actinokineospora spheciospongiae]
MEEEFARARERLLAVAYGITGDRGAAEDVVQEAWLRLVSSREPVDDVTGWLVVVTSRLALDVVKSARHRREQYVGQWLPEPLVELDADPADRVTLDESVTLALLVVLETLSPAERTVFLLHEVFGLPFTEVAGVVGRTPAAVRQLASRARRHVADRAPRFEPDPVRQRAVVSAFATACAGDDLGALLALLDPDVVLRSDGGGFVSAARNPVVGADRVARFLAGVQRRKPAELRPVRVNGWAGLLRVHQGHPTGVMALTVADGRVTAVDIVLNPEKLARVRAAHVEGTP